MEVLEKHKRYLEHHVPGEVFWGLGIENETYIELYDGRHVTAEFLHNQKRERYSVDYWKQYKEGAVAKAIAEWIQKLPHGSNTLHLPLLLNGHTFTKCDAWGEHATTFAANPAPNKKYAGQTLLEMLEVQDPTVFKDGHGIWWCFDGDTVEFMTQAFRCATVEGTLLELLDAKAKWMAALRTSLAAIPCEAALKGPIGWPKQNHGLATFLTNRDNIAIFNNGTYHINITAPSRLSKDGTIEDWPRFLHIHRQAARLFQWLSPFLVAAYGSGDIFGHFAPQARGMFPAGSQRLAASRYVSVGTYDTHLMPRGKVVTTSTAEMVPPPTWWHEMYSRRQVAYEKLDSIGYDINFNKFPNHGLEFRIFDWFGEEALGPLLEVLVVLMDRAMSVPRTKEVPYPQDSAVWRATLGRVVWEGADALLLSRELRVFAAVLGVPELQHAFHRPVLEAYEIVRRAWATRDGPCSSRMFLHVPKPVAPVLEPMSVVVEAPRRNDVKSVLTSIDIGHREIRPHHIQLPPLPPPPRPPHPCSQRFVPGVPEVAIACCRGFFARCRTIR